MQTRTARRTLSSSSIKELGRTTGSARVAPELSDPVGSLEVAEHEGVEKLGAGRRRQGLETSPESGFHLVEGHRRTLVCPVSKMRRHFRRARSKPPGFRCGAGTVRSSGLAELESVRSSAAEAHSSAGLDRALPSVVPCPGAGFHR
jgi:hypothetical protein